MEAATPELDAACVSHVFSFVDDAATIGAALRVCRLWRRCARDNRLPVWAEMDAARFRALHLGSEAPAFCACAVVHSLRHGAGRSLRRLDLSAASACDTCRLRPPLTAWARLAPLACPLRGWEPTCRPQTLVQFLALDVNVLAELCEPGRAPGACTSLPAAPPAPDAAPQFWRN